MSYYQEQISKIKERGSKDFININSSENTIVLKLVDDSDETANLLTEWREKFKNMFATYFDINKERTKNWIRDSIIQNPDRILFIIYFNGKKVGAIGTALYDGKTNSAHIDNLMKDPSCNYAPLIPLVEKIYLKWMFDGLKLSKIQGLLFRDNFPTLNLHQFVKRAKAKYQNLKKLAIVFMCHLSVKKSPIVYIYHLSLK